ncbi:MAG: exosortase/archaeosortase family protein [Anaerolineae bacterium]|nr:exosortase/archaeosortase family protein [Anaerolineae bacterium]
MPDTQGWVGLNITLECSTLIELSIFAGLLLFYPKLTLKQRAWAFAVGLLVTYVLNLGRIVLIVGMILALGREAIPLAHNLVARLLYFVGILFIYWFLLTRPTLFAIRRTIESQGLGVD